jgi:phospholipase/carboxylesterase
LIGPLLQSLEALGFIARHFNPADFGEVMEAAGSPDVALRAARPRLDAWPDELAGVRARLQSASDTALAAFDDLRAAPEDPDGLRAVFRALRHLPRAQEALYPLAAGLPPVSRFFLSSGSRDDAGLQQRLAAAPDRDDTGVMHFGGEPGARGGWSMYVPEYYSENQAWPLVVALHGGSGNGRSFLWSWLRDARAHGAILVAPTAIGDTWALSGPDTDTPNLARIVDDVRGRWRIDPARMLLTGMSDGGTFSYVSGLEPASPFTHLAPASAAFHPMLAAMADPDRIRGLPIHLSHGALDWMFPVSMARQARDALTAAGARVTYREIEDLSHTYPRELNPAILAWLGV